MNGRIRGIGVGTMLSRSREHDRIGGISNAIGQRYHQARTFGRFLPTLTAHPMRKCPGKLKVTNTTLGIQSNSEGISFFLEYQQRQRQQRHERLFGEYVE